jgi:hypothetical protein
MVSVWTGYGLDDTMIVFRSPSGKRFIFLGKVSPLCLNLLVNKTDS